MSDMPSKLTTLEEIRAYAAKIVIENDRFGLPAERLAEKINAVAAAIMGKRA